MTTLQAGLWATFPALSIIAASCGVLYACTGSLA